MEVAMELSGKSALVTGAGRGLGAEIARALAARGAKVVLVARNRAELAAVAEGIRRAGGEAHPLVADIAEKAAIYPLVQAAAEAVGPIDVLVQCASSLGPLPMPLLFDTACEDLGAVLETNVVGPFRLAKAVGPSMIVRGGGALVFVSSDAAVDAYPRWGAYGTSKAAQDHLARILAAELTDSAVRVLVVDPGEMDTRMHADALPEADRSSLLRPSDVARVVVDAIADGERSGTRFSAPARLAAERS